MQLRELIEAMERIAPTRYAEPWDNVGLLAGDPQQGVSRAMLTIDYTAAVADEARAAGCDAVVAYHPPLFHAVKRLAAPSLVFDAIRRGVAIYSPHTALDVADGGTNDLLADAIGLTDRAPLRPTQGQAAQCKLVTFAPEANVEAVCDALFEAGAGRIGEYRCCSFRSPGTGTFFGEEGTNPAVGEAGRLQRSAEIRVETVVPLDKVSAVVAALRRAHPYETPAFDLNTLAAPPEAVGQGRIGTMPPAERGEVFDRIKRALGIDRLLIAGPTSGTVSRAAACAGACGEFLDDAIRGGAQLYLTGEIRHHDALKAAEANVTVVCTLHSNSERAVLPRIKARLNEELPSLDVRVSGADRDPFAIA